MDTQEVAFVVGETNTIVRCQKAFLAGQSDVFKAMFSLPMKESQADSIHIPDCDAVYFQSCVDFLQTGQVEILPSNIFELYALARKYLLGALVTTIIKWVKENGHSSFDDSELLQAIATSKELDSPLLTHQFIRILVSRWTPRVGERLLEYHEDLPEDLVATILSSNELLMNEVEVLLFLIEYQRRRVSSMWDGPPSSSSSEGRLAKPLLEAVRFPLLTSSSLARFVYTPCPNMLPSEILVTLFAHAALHPPSPASPTEYLSIRDRFQLHPTAALLPESTLDCFDATGERWSFSTRPRKSYRVLVYSGDDEACTKGVQRSFSNWLLQYWPMVYIEWKRNATCPPEELEAFLQLGTTTPTTPTTQYEEPFDAVLLWSRWDSFKNGVAVGRVLNRFVRERGGVMVVMHFGWDKKSGLSPEAEGDVIKCLLPLAPGKKMTSSNCSLGRLVDPDHPLLYGVTNFNGGDGGYRSKCDVSNGGQLVAEWEDRTPLVATLRSGRGRVTALNFYPVCNGIYSDGWKKETDGFRLMLNALLYRGDSK